MVKRARATETNRRADVEAFLLKHHVTHTYRENVSTSLFDVERSLKNQARLGHPLNEATVKRYTEALHEGDVFPPVLAEHTDHGLMVLDGNHRLAAHIRAGVTIDVYVCEAPPQTLLLLTYIANAKHGLPATEEDRIHHAKYLVGSGVPSAVAAAQLQVPHADLKRALAREKATARADDAGILRPHWERIAAPARARLANVHTDEGLRAAVSLVNDAGLSVTEVDRLVVAMNATRSGARQAAVVADQREAWADRIADVTTTGSDNRMGRRHRTARQRLVMALGAIKALPSPEVFERDPVPEPLRAGTLAQVDAAMERLTEIRKALDTVES